MSEPVFELVGLAETEDSPVLLGLWSAAAPEPVSFSVEETGPPVPVWRFNIPDDDDQAEQWLTEGEKRLLMNFLEMKVEEPWGSWSGSSAD